MRIKKNINKGITNWSNTKILQIYMIRNIWQTVRRITNEIMGVKGLRFIVFVMKSILLYQTRKSHFDNKTNCRPELIQ